MACRSGLLALGMGLALGLGSALALVAGEDEAEDTYPLLDGGAWADLEALLRGDPDARLAHGWRAEVAGGPIRNLVEGRAALAFDGNGGLVLERRSHDPL